VLGNIRKTGEKREQEKEERKSAIEIDR